jgi:hypothetical protein
MSEKIRIALDCIGGDFGASVVLAGAELSLTQLSNVEFFAFGDRATLEPLIVKRLSLYWLGPVQFEILEPRQHLHLPRPTYDNRLWPATNPAAVVRPRDFQRNREPRNSHRFHRPTHTGRKNVIADARTITATPSLRRFAGIGRPLFTAASAILAVILCPVSVSAPENNSATS